MSALAESTLALHLTDRDSLVTLAREGLDPELIPSEAVRRVYVFALNYFFDSGKTKAPSPGAIQTEFGDVLDQEEIDLNEEPEDSIEWAIDTLKGMFVYREAGIFNRTFAKAMAEADTSDRVRVLQEYATELVTMTAGLESRDRAQTLADGVDDRMLAYEIRKANKGSVFGAQFGMAQFDAFTGGIQDGELCVVAAGPKVGKSYFLNWIAYQEWKAGRVAVLVTLENSIGMTIDRIACQANMIDAEAYSRGESEPEEEEKVRDWISDLKRSDVPLHIVQPDRGHRSMQMLIREAQVRDADTILLDQLTFVEFEDSNRPKTERIGDALHDAKALISTARKPIPMILAHQINREGVKAAQKEGHLEMYHLAESAEVERTSDWVFGIHQTEAQKPITRALLQTLAARRAANRHFEMFWNPSRGHISVRGNVTI